MGIYEFILNHKYAQSKALFFFSFFFSFSFLKKNEEEEEEEEEIKISFRSIFLSYQLPS